MDIIKDKFGRIVVIQNYRHSDSYPEQTYIVAFGRSVADSNLNNSEYVGELTCPRCQAHIFVAVN